MRPQVSLTRLARLGFERLTVARDELDRLPHRIRDLALPAFGAAADPDQALEQLHRLVERAPDETHALLGNAGAAERLIRILGASRGLGEFFLRHPEHLAVLAEELDAPRPATQYRDDLCAAVQGLALEPAWDALRTRYRRHLAALTAWDLAGTDPLARIAPVTAALADLAGAALEASLVAARTAVPFDASQVDATKLAIIGMGKAGARELNYVSDVDVVFVVEAAAGLETGTAVDIGTRLAMLTMRGVSDLASEPALWEVDANLRPEGKDGALVRTLESHVAYYERWAKSWEFQALIKARPMAGDLDLGQRYADAIAPLVWKSSSREGFVEGVQRMRERVTEHIPPDEVDVQLKLGPGGIRDIEFTIQLLQLVHGATDDTVRQAGSLDALEALAAGSYIGREEAAEFARNYEFLRVLEHRLQLERLTRTHLMPRDRETLRILARASGLAASADALLERWTHLRSRVRTLHQKLFYRPLLAAVASLSDEDLALSSEHAEARLAAIGFVDPAGALSHIAAMTSGVSRRSQIQRTLLPVMLQWFADGADPDYGLLAFRRLSDELGKSYWYLRMLRDSSGAAQRLCEVLSASRYVGGLLERLPESAVWLENDADLKPRSLSALREESSAIVRRHKDVDAAAKALRGIRRRETLRMALGSILGVVSIEELGVALADITTVFIDGVLSAIRRDEEGLEFAVIAVGRYGGSELGFGSDADVLYVQRATTLDSESAQRRAQAIVSELIRLTEDPRLPFELDADLRPEGRNGPVVRSLEAYRAYYQRWSLTWEAQALLRARPVAGDAPLGDAFAQVADAVRFPAAMPEADVREVKRIKARVEAERLPQAADPARHLKLGRGSLSDVEWLVQLLQLQHAAEIPALRTTSTLTALNAAVEHELMTAPDAAILREAWVLASRIRSALTLWTGRTSDVLPTDRQELEGVARLLGYRPRSATRIEEDYLRITRRARSVFERRFYGLTGPRQTL